MIDLIAFLGNANRYDKYRSFINDNVLSKESKLIVEDLGKYYSSSKLSEVDWTIFQVSFFSIYHPTMKSDVVKIYQSIFDKLRAHEPDEELEETLVESFMARSAATKIYRLAQDIAEGTKSDMDSITTVMDTYDDDMGKTTDVDTYEMKWDINHILDSTVAGGGLEWRLPAFNKCLGPLRKGNFIIIGARPDTGKTTMLAAEATYMAQQLPLGEKVLWINNEEAGEAVQLRIIQAALGKNSEEIHLNRADSDAEFIKLLGEENKIVFIDKADISVKEIEIACTRYPIGLIVIDQLWKVRGIEDATNDVHRMTKLFNFGRELAKRWAPVIVVHQADKSAGGVKYLSMEQLYMGKTGPQGEADAIIMIGRSYEEGEKHSRFINVPKNKLTGGVGTVPSMRNMQIEVTLHAEIARFEEPKEV